MLLCFSDPPIFPKMDVEEMAHNHVLLQQGTLAKTESFHPKTNLLSMFLSRKHCFGFGKEEKGPIIS